MQTSADLVTVEAKPEPIAIQPERTALLVIDMQNDFGSPGGSRFIARA